MSQITHTPYTLWPTRKTADPRAATQAQFVHGLTEILEHQAPMQALSLFQTYVKASGLMKIATPVRRKFERAITLAEKSGVIIVEREPDPEADGPEDSVGWILRLTNQKASLLARSRSARLWVSQACYRGDELLVTGISEAASISPEGRPKRMPKFMLKGLAPYLEG